MMAELTLRWLEPQIGQGKFEHARRAARESVYFHRRTQPASGKDPSGKHWAAFDRTLGWRNIGWKLHGGREESVNSQHWRSKKEFEATSPRRRIILTGDSFVYGWSVGDDETIGAHLEQELGGEFEVLNMGARGYGLDQMALVATEIAPHYQHEAIVIAFIEDDLRRSCHDFQWELKRPRFVWRGGHVVPAGIPVPTPEETFARHQLPKQKLLDWAAALAVRSRIASLIGQIYLQPVYERCLTDLNAAILEYVCDRTGTGVRKIFVHLDGTLPPGFVARVRELPAVYLSVPSHVPRLAAEMRVQPGRLDGLHPNAALNRIYGRAISMAVRAHR
jgi:hypothetical protein